MASKHKTSDCTYREFVQWASERLADAVITGGLKEMRSTFEHSVMVFHHQIINDGGFKKEN